MAEQINLNKTVYSKTQYERVIDTSFTQLVEPTPIPPTNIPAISVAEFFNNYQEIFGESIDDLCIDYFEFHQYSDSRNKYGDFWNEAGVPNGELRKTGGFEILESSAE